MVEAADLLRQGHRDLEAFELGTERGAADVTDVAVDGARGRGLGVVDLRTDIGDELLEALEGLLDDARLVGGVVRVGKMRPVVPLLVDGGDDRVPRVLGVRTGVRVVDRVGARGGVEVDELVAGERLGLGGEHEVADVRDGLAFAHAHVDLAGRGVHADLAGFLEERRLEGVFAAHLEDGVLDVGVGDDGRAGDFGFLALAGAAEFHAHDAAAAGGVFFDVDLLDEHVATDVDPVGLHLGGHEVDHGVRAALEDEHALRHEVREDDAEGDRGVVERGAVGVGDRLEEQALDVRAAGEELLEELARGARVVVVVVHLAQMREEGLDGLGGELELLDQDAREVGAVEGRADVEVGVDEADVVQLVDPVRDLLGPVAAGGLDHPVREAVQGDVEDVAADALEVGGQAAELVVVLEEQHLAAELREVVRRGHPAEAGADDDGVVAREEVVERRGHCGSR